MNTQPTLNSTITPAADSLDSGSTLVNEYKALNAAFKRIDLNSLEILGFRIVSTTDGINDEDSALTVRFAMPPKVQAQFVGGPMEDVYPDELVGKPTDELK